MKKRMLIEVRKLFMNGKVVQGCFPMPMVQKIGLGRGGQVLMIQKLEGVDLSLKDGDIVIRRADSLIELVET